MDAEAGSFIDAATALPRQPLPIETVLRLEWRPYSFRLRQDMITSRGAWSERRGWLLRLSASDGRLGWGEAALPPKPTRAAETLGRQGAPADSADPDRTAGGRRPVRRDHPAGAGAAPPPLRPTSSPQTCGGIAGDEPANSDTIRPARANTAATPEDSLLLPALASLPPVLQRGSIETLLPGLPSPLACALGMALAELDGLGSTAQGGWLKPPASALLLPAGEAAITALERALTERPQAVSRAQDGARDRAASRHTVAGPGLAGSGGPGADGLGAHDIAFTVKWKVAAADDTLERQVLEALLTRLPPDSRLRLDANGGWDRTTAWRWASRLAGDPRLEWLEQPLPPDDRQGLEQLAAQLPVALDESLRCDPALCAAGWPGWQVRRPLAEGDPRPLLATLLAGTPRLMLSTALETGIGRRLLNHLAALQALGPTPSAPGLAPGWCPPGELFADDPAAVWEAAR